MFVLCFSSSSPTFIVSALQVAGGISEPRIPPLQLGDPENGYLTEANLLAISLQISQDWRNIGINLGFSYEELDRIQYKHRWRLGTSQGVRKPLLGIKSVTI